MGQSRQEKVVKAVRSHLHDVLHTWNDSFFEGLARLWTDFAMERDVSRTQKSGTWAAAALYAFDRAQLGGLTQEEAASLFDVSALSVSQKYQELCDTVDLRVLDERYLPEERREAVRREFGPVLPEGVPVIDAPRDLWHFPLDHRPFDDYATANDVLWDGWEQMAHDVDEAAQSFRDALELDPQCSDAYNGLGHVALHRDDAETALDHFKTAYHLARESLGTEAPNTYPWWLDTDTRPYMRAREGKGLALERLGRYHEAAQEYDALLRLNPNDNQGVRFLHAPALLLTGDLQDALDAFAAYAETYPEDWGEPGHTLSHGLGLFLDDQFDAALRKWWSAIQQNVYLIPTLLDTPLPDAEGWFASNVEHPSYVASYPREYGDLWDGSIYDAAPTARETLRRLWETSDVQDLVDRIVTLRHEMDDAVGDIRAGDESAREAWDVLCNRFQTTIRRRLPSITASSIVEAL